jgi:hypothetical protein
MLDRILEAIHRQAKERKQTPSGFILVQVWGDEALSLDCYSDSNLGHDAVACVADALLLAEEDDDEIGAVQGNC